MTKRLQLFFLILFLFEAYFLLAIEPVGSGLEVQSLSGIIILAITSFSMALISPLPVYQGAGKYVSDKQKSVSLFITHIHESNYFSSVFSVTANTEEMKNRSFNTASEEINSGVLNLIHFPSAPFHNPSSFFNRAVESSKVQPFSGVRFFAQLKYSAIFGVNTYTIQSTNFKAAQTCLNLKSPDTKPTGTLNMFNGLILDFVTKFRLIKQKTYSVVCSY